jgi:DNA-binding beta-propeller fold protein YncE
LENTNFDSPSPFRNVAISPDGQLVYFSDNGIPPNNTICAVSTFDNAATILTVGVNPGPMAISSDGRGYVVNPNAISVVDTATHDLETIPLEASPNSVAVTPDGNHAYVGCGDCFVVIDTSSLAPTTFRSANPADEFNQVVAHPNGGFVYFVGSNGSVMVVETATNGLVTQIPSVGAENGIAITPDGQYVCGGSINGVGLMSTIDYSVTAIPGPGAIGEFLGQNCIAVASVPQPPPADHPKFGSGVSFGGVLGAEFGAATVIVEELGGGIVERLLGTEPPIVINLGPGFVPGQGGGKGRDDDKQD